MYGIRNIGEVDYLIGSEVERMTFWRYGVNIYLSGDACLSIRDFDCYSLTIGGETEVPPSGEADAMRVPTRLPALSAQRIAAIRTSDEELEFAMESGDTLVLRDTNPCYYETFDISAPGKFSVV